MEPQEQDKQSDEGKEGPRLRKGSPDDPRSLGSSPHLVQVRERIRINGKPISPELFTKHFWHLYNQLEEFKVLWLEGWQGPISPGRGMGCGALAPDSFLCAGWQPRFHALLLPLPHAHGLPCLPPGEGEYLS